MAVTPTILCGGSGSRLWPLSREQYPKQFLQLGGDETLLQQTLARLQGLDDLAAPLLLCHEDHRFLVAEQLREMGLTAGPIVLEPAARNTAPAVATAALVAHRRDPDGMLLVLAADHVIADRAAFQRAVQAARTVADQQRLVTFGVHPTEAHTGYGYIRMGQKLVGLPMRQGVDPAGYEVAEFVEKPDRERAQAYLSSGEYLWNSGMFLFPTGLLLSQMRQFAPQIVAACEQALAGAEVDNDFLRLDAAAFAASPSDSVDYAVMEKTRHAAVVPMEADWSDVGSWSALWQVSEADDGNNVCRGDILQHDTSGCYLDARSRLLATVGLQDHVVVETADAVLVAPRDRAQDVRHIVAQLQQHKRSEATTHRRVYRPWGWYETLDLAERFQVKHISVKPGAALSLQLHHHRAEHWVVVSGTATVTRGDEVLMLAENESTYIPLGTRHRLENHGMIPLELIEIQSGSYLGEDDIVRFDDQYGRQNETDGDGTAGAPAA